MSSSKKFKSDKRANAVATTSSANDWHQSTAEFDTPKPTATLEGQQYMHFGSSKFIYVKQNNRQEVAFTFGDFTFNNESGAWITNDKVELNLTQFCILAGHILTGAGDRKAGQSEAAAQFHLTNKMYFSWSTFNSIVSCSIRYWKDQADGQKQATRNGISLGMSSYCGLKELLISMLPFRLLVPFGLSFQQKDGLKYEHLREYVRVKMFAIVEETKLQECFACQTLQSDAPHDCKVPTVLQHWLDAENRLVGQRYVEGLLLLKNQTNPKAVTELDVKAYLRKHRMELHGKSDWLEDEPNPASPSAATGAAVGDKQQNK